MMSFPIFSVEKKFCTSSAMDVLEDVDICFNCQQIPLPSFRSNIQPNNFYCKKCYELQNFSPNTIMLPHKREIKLLEKLIISCKFFQKGCSETYSINNLEELLFHEKNCHLNHISSNYKNAPLDIDSNYDYFCRKCSSYYNTPHECISEMSKSLKLLYDEVIL